MKHVGSPDLQGQLLRLGTLVQLAKRARQAESPQELGFVMVNESHQLVPYRQAALWQWDASRAKSILALSGTPAVERGSPYAQWLAQAFADLARAGGDGTARMVGAGDLKEALGRQWGEWLPAYGLLVPLAGRRGRMGALLFAREQPWGEADRHLLQELAEAYAHASENLLGKRRGGASRGLRRVSGWAKLGIAGLLAASLLLPVHLSALAPAEIVAFQPTIVRAPLDGVLDRVEVAPNAEVAEGELLLTLDPRALANKLEVAVKTLAIAEAEYRQAAQQALFDDKSRAQLAVLKGRTDQRRADVEYVRSLLERVNVTASRSGIALYSDPNDWIGRPVSLGERIMEIADPKAAEIEIWLPVADAITLAPGAEVDMFLNVAPDAPIRARLRQASYEATASPAGVLGYRLKATLDETQAIPRIGLRGTAKVYGERVSLFYFLMRRPLAAARQFLGL